MNGGYKSFEIIFKGEKTIFLLEKSETKAALLPPKLPSIVAVFPVVCSIFSNPFRPYRLQLGIRNEELPPILCPKMITQPPRAHCKWMDVGGASCAATSDKWDES